MTAIAIATDGVAWSVSLSVSVCGSVRAWAPQKAEPIEMPFGGPRNHVLDGDLDPKGKGAILGVVRPIGKHYESLLRCMLQQHITE